MRIGINALYMLPGGVGGTEIYLRELLKGLARVDTANEYFVFSNFETAADLVPKQANFHWKPQAIHARFRPGRILWEQIALPIEASRYRLDVMLNAGFTAALMAPCAQVTVFHDLQHKRHPEYFRWFDLPFWRFLLWASVHRSRSIIAVSEATRADLEKFYPFTKDRVTVVHHGVDESFFELKREKTEAMLLCVSTLHPHKNLERLIRAYARKKRAFKLTIAGMRGFHAEAIDKVVAELDCGDSVKLTGWIPREELMSLYARARAFVYPSTFEGFGMPVLEAMAAGMPLACSDIPVLREVAVDTAVYFDPADEGAIESAMEKVMIAGTNTRGRERASEFTWDRAARGTLAVLTGEAKLPT